MRINVRYFAVAFSIAVLTGLPLSLTSSCGPTRGGGLSRPGAIDTSSPPEVGTASQSLNQEDGGLTKRGPVAPVEKPKAAYRGPNGAPSTEGPQEIPAELEQISKRMEMLGTEMARCGDDSTCIKRIRKEMDALNNQAQKMAKTLIQEHAKHMRNETQEPPGEPETSPRPTVKGGDYKGPCGAWIRALDECLAQSQPAARNRCLRGCLTYPCLPLKTTITTKAKFYLYNTDCGWVEEDLFFDYEVAGRGEMICRSDFSRFGLLVPIYEKTWSINDAHGLEIERKDHWSCRKEYEHHFSKSDVSTAYGRPLHSLPFGFQVEYPTEAMQCNIYFHTLLDYVTFSGYDGLMMDYAETVISETNNPGINCFISPEIMRRAVRELKFQHTFHFKKNIEHNDAEGYIDQTMSVNIEFEPLECRGYTDGAAGAIAFVGACTDEKGYIVVAEPSSVFINGLPVARVGDNVYSPTHGVTEIIGKGSCKVFVKEKPVARVGDQTTKGARIVGGSSDVFAAQR